MKSGLVTRRWFLWGWLVLLVALMLGTLIWLAGRYEVSQVQAQIERDAADGVSDIRGALQRNVQTLQSLLSEARSPAAWTQEAQDVLRQHREWVRIEWRNPELRVVASADTPFRQPVFARYGRDNALPEVNAACALAKRQSGPGYSHSIYVSAGDGIGLETMEVCLPWVTNGE